MKRVDDIIGGGSKNTKKTGSGFKASDEDVKRYADLLDAVHSTVLFNDKTYQLVSTVVIGLSATVALCYSVRQLVNMYRESVNRRRLFAGQNSRKIRVNGGGGVNIVEIDQDPSVLDTL